MIQRFFRAFFWAVLVASVVAWGYFGVVSASTREAVLIEDRYSGLDESIVEPGSMRFVPNRIFPGRVTLHRVDVGPRILRLQHKKGLAESEMLGLDDSFYIQTELRLEYKLLPERLQALFLRLEEPNWDRLDPYLRVRLNYFLNRKLQSLYEDTANLDALELLLYDYVRGPDLLTELNQEFLPDGVVFRNILPSRLYVPDAGLYRAILADEGLILQQKRDRLKLVDDAHARQAAERIQDEAYFARLERIGALVRKYPQLKDYLAIDRLSDNVEVIVVPSDRWFPTEIERARANSAKRRTETPEPVPNNRVQREPAAPAPNTDDRFRDLTPP